MSENLEGPDPGPPDEELIRLHRTDPDSVEGRDAVSALFGRYERRVAAWCMRVLGNRPDIADCTQEVFLRLYERIDKFRGESLFSTWVYTVTRNICLNWIRDHRELPQKSLEDEESFQIADSRIEEVSARLENAEEQESLRRLIQSTLTREEAEILLLHFGHGLTLDSITRCLGLTNASGAKAYIVSAKRKLKRKIELFLSGSGAGLTKQAPDEGTAEKRTQSLRETKDP